MSNRWLNNKLALRINYGTGNKYYVDYIILNIWKERLSNSYPSSYAYVVDRGGEVGVNEEMHLQIQEAFARGDEELTI